MKVILLDNIKGVGRKDDVIEANDRYARNFLIPKKLAIPANAENMSKLKGKQDSKAHQKDVDKKAAEEMKEKLSKIILKIKVKAGGNGKIFGGVTSKEVSEQLKAQYNYDVDKKKIEIKETIKNIGMFTIKVKLFEGVVGEFKIDII
jgi:large subunit ribosomal protein L9